MDEALVGAKPVSHGFRAWKQGMEAGHADKLWVFKACRHAKGKCPKVSGRQLKALYTCRVCT